MRNTYQPGGYVPGEPDQRTRQALLRAAQQNDKNLDAYARAITHLDIGDLLTEYRRFSRGTGPQVSTAEYTKNMGRLSSVHCEIIKRVRKAEESGGRA